MSSTALTATLEAAARAVEGGDPREILRTAQRAQDALDAAKASAMLALHCSGDHELDGAATVKTWARNELRLDARESSQLLAAGTTLQQLDDVAEAARDGRIGLAHVTAFTYGTRHIDLQVVRESQPWLLDVATTHEPSALRKVIRGLREALYPDSLDEEWARGMDRQDISVEAVPEGFHVNGFLNVTTGAKLKLVLDTLAAPKDKDDLRTGADRRVAALDELMSSVLAGGLPTDKGIRPQLSVIVEADAPARLAGFGPIGPRLLSCLACEADLTAITTTGGPLDQAQVLNVGRAHRTATLKQRRAIIARQGGVCAAHGCSNTHLEIHHVTAWSAGGRTDVDEMVGLCVRCHHLLHRHLLHLSPGPAPGHWVAHGTDPRPGREAYRRRLAAHRETATIRRLARDLRQRREQRAPRGVPLRV